MIKMKKTIIMIVGILLVLTMFSVVSAFDYSEDDDGNSFLETMDKVIAPQITLTELVTLQPGLEPENPEVGMIYFDSESNRLKLYDGTGWYALALEKVSTVSKQQVVEVVEKKGEAKVCSESTECGDWGECINNYQSVICVTIDESCNKYEDVETRDCVSDFELESPAKGSHDVDVESGSEKADDDVEESEEVCKEICEDVCTIDEEVCSESCSTDDEGNEVCEEICEAEEVCEEVCREVCEVPEELFDITFDLEESSLSKSDKLVLWATLQNFGKRYVPARIIYVVSDDDGEEVYREFEEIRVYTDESIIKKFDNLVLDDGNYVLSMKVEYAGIVEEFSDSFAIESGFFVSIKRFFSGWF